MYVLYISGCQLGEIQSPKKHLAMAISEDIFGACYWNLVGGSRDAVKHPTVHRAASHSKELSSLKCQ